VSDLHSSPSQSYKLKQMAPNISRLRRWFATGAVVVVVVVTGAYFYARHRFSLAGHLIPKKINIQVQQTADSFTISKSEAGRTIFTIRATKAVQYKEGGHAELHDVSITIYGKDSQRFDQIYGADFDYSPQTGMVVAKGEVQIDLEANPGGLTRPDQALPPELKNPIHVKTSGLVFNQKTGDAYTPEKVEFRVAEANGTAVGATYTAKAAVLEMKSQVDVVLLGATPATVKAARGALRKDPLQIDLDQQKTVRGDESFESEHATVYLRKDSTVDRVVGTGNVRMHFEGKAPINSRSERAELFMANSDKPKNERNLLSKAVLSGNVQMENSGPDPMHSTAGRVILNFTGKNVFTTARAEQGVKLFQHHAATDRSADSAHASNSQDVEVDAPAMNFVIDEGRRLESAVTDGAAQILISPPDPTSGQHTVVTARKFTAKFDDNSRLKTLHGEPDAKIVNSAPGQVDRVSTSDTLDAAFHPGGGIQSLVQEGKVEYVDADLKAWGDRARYTPVDQTLYLSGAPRVVERGMTTTAKNMRMNRVSGDAYAEGNVKSTYSELKPQPDGALLASSSPIHVTARNMVTHRNPGVATYTGTARLWQDANVVEAPSIEFDRDHRSIVATSAAGKLVSTALVQTDKSGKQTPVAITSDRLTYTDSERKAHFEGNVVVKSADATMTGKQVDAYMEPRGQSAASVQNSGEPGGASRLDKIVSDGNIVIVQPTRRALGDHLVYTAAEDKFVLTGSAPSIFDAERGKVTGDSLTFYKRDDRVLVEGDAKSPTVTQTRVAR
jgi:lipopolysaccharide export system protein LptA